MGETMKNLMRPGIAVAALVALAAGSPAIAADMAVPVYRGGPPPVGPYNWIWTGCYIGGQIGGQWSSWIADVRFPPFFDYADQSFRDDGRFIYGGQVGCNYQPIGTPFVAGLEADVVGASRREFGGEVFRFAPPAATDHFDASGAIRAQGSLRVRLGVALDRMLLYAAGGVSWANISATHTVLRDGVGAVATSVSSTRSGWNVGIGAEYLFANNWTIGLEYRYADYGSFDYAIPANAGAFPFPAHTASVDHWRTHDVRLRLNYLFSAGPVVARY
jgi:outer membrane immunogenic protein